GYALPKTGLSVSISTIRYNYDNSFQYERKAIMPDHWVNTSAQDLNQELDSQIQFVLKLLSEK
ncbi:MAG: hypothetical protein ACKO7B_12315, partial [Flavobacteriales bacterium]